MIFLLILSPYAANAQFTSDFKIEDDDLTIGGDIFNDFNEELEESQVLEDERYYRFGRFFTFQVGIGGTGFTGNRGAVTAAEPPGYTLGFVYFLNFNVAFGIGLDFSKHNMIFRDRTFSFSNQENGPGLVEVSFLRPYFSVRYYLDTSNLGTAITWSNPHLIGRLEFWNQTNDFIDQPTIGEQTGGGLGFGLGFGLEFPIVLKEYYVSLRFLYHTVNYFDKFTQGFRSVLLDPNGAPTVENPLGDGIDDLTGDAYSIFVSYVVNW